MKDAFVRMWETLKGVVGSAVSDTVDAVVERLNPPQPAPVRVRPARVRDSRRDRK